MHVQSVLYSSSIHCGDSNWTLWNLKTQVVFVANFFSFFFISHEKYSTLFFCGFTHIQLKSSTKKGNSEAVRVKNIFIFWYSLSAEYQQQVGLKEKIPLLLLHWCLKAVWIHARCNFQLLIYASMVACHSTFAGGWQCLTGYNVVIVTTKEITEAMLTWKKRKSSTHRSTVHHHPLMINKF